MSETCKHCGDPSCRVDFVTATGDNLFPQSEYMIHALRCRDRVSAKLAKIDRYADMLLDIHPTRVGSSIANAAGRDLKRLLAEAPLEVQR